MLKFQIQAGGLVTIVGYYTPFIHFGTAVFTVGSGLIYTQKDPQLELRPDLAVGAT